MDKTMKTFSEALDRFSPVENGKKAPEKVQLLIATKDNETCEPYFRFRVDSKFYQNPKPEQGFEPGEVTFNQLLGIKLFDLMGREAIAKPFLGACIKKFAAEIGVEPKVINLMVITQLGPQNKYVLIPILYNGFKQVRQLNWEGDIFDQETLMKTENDIN